MLASVADWAAGVPDVRAVALVGSYAYRRPRMSSDVDLVVLTDVPGRYGAWLGDQPPIGPALLIRRGDWGPLTEYCFRRRSGLQVEVGVAPASWAATEPVDAGTARVVGHGLRVVHDPEGLLAALRATVGALRR